uniref:Uncharacterized protein n=1 Tax=Timema bartmani TaxID=61472 RepID=A0A7R9ERU1_9NEOP|nr:unnamed protein product [Timema bartmani]
MCTHRTTIIEAHLSYMEITMGTRCEHVLVTLATPNRTTNMFVEILGPVSKDEAENGQSLSKV